MIQLVFSLSIALRKRLPETPQDYFALGTIAILYAFYAARKEKWFTDLIKWISGGVLFIGGIIGLFYFTGRWFRFFCWSLTSPLAYVILYTSFRNYLLNKKNYESYLYDDPKVNFTQLSDEEDFDMHKILVFIIALLILAGLFIA